MMGIREALSATLPLLKSSPPDAPTLDRLEPDPRRWLEEVEGTDALDWVRAKNDEALSVLGNPEENALYTRILEILDSKEKIPYVGRVLNNLYYNFWQDQTHVQGIWRRCAPDEYRKADPAWETVLDLDDLSARDGVKWVWHGSTVLDEGPEVRTDRVIIRLSRGGSDADEAREFDLDQKAFIPPDEGGFFLPEAKSSFSYRDRDTLLVGGGFFGEGALTDSGYPRTARVWKRGTPLQSAVEVFAGEVTDVSVYSSSYLERTHRYTWRTRGITFYTSAHLLQLGPEGFGEAIEGLGFRRVPVPEDAEVSTFKDQILIELRSDWLGYKGGSKLAAPAAAFMATREEDEAAMKALITPLFEPTDTCSLEGASESLNFVILSVLDNVRSEARFWHYAPAATLPRGGGAKGASGGGTWTLRHTFRDEGLASVSASGVDSAHSDDIWVTSSSYTQPTTYSIASAAAPAKQERLKALPAFYDAAGLQVEQLFATSLDGTRVPYFLVSREERPADGSTPTLLYGYGGFEISMTPGYAATVGVGWLEKGCAYAVANIRGGGEYGPRWHQAALKEKRHKAYEDFEAVARDLVSRGVTRRERLGIQGGSNGGLLMGNMLARSPGLFGAIVCQVPLLDMRRYNKLLAGASWMGEFGNPDVADEWSYLQNYSPYHTMARGAAAPPTLITTSTRDDRVHPGHARKLAGKMVDLGLPVLSYENIEGGHGGAANNRQRAFMSTLAWVFLRLALVDETIHAALKSRTNRDGGSRRLASAACILRGALPLPSLARRLPRWLLPAVSAAALAAVLALPMRRLR